MVCRKLINETHRVGILETVYKWHALGQCWRAITLIDYSNFYLTASLVSHYCSNQVLYSNRFKRWISVMVTAVKLCKYTLTVYELFSMSSARDNCETCRQLLCERYNKPYEIMFVYQMIAARNHRFQIYSSLHGK